MAKHSSSLLELARRGAQARYEELQAEIGSLMRQFPGLASGTREVIRRGKRAVAAAAKELGSAPRKRRRLSAAARKRISDAQKKRWALRRDEKK